MTRLLARCLITGAMLLVAGCQPLAGADDDDQSCPQTREFGNYGCARLVVMVQGPPQPWPASYRWDVRSVPAHEGTGTGLALPSRADSGAIALQLTRWHRPAPGSENSASVWVIAKMLEDPQPPQAGVPLRVFASDSVLHVARFAPVGSRPPVDTVRLTLRRP